MDIEQMEKGHRKTTAILDSIPKEELQTDEERLIVLKISLPKFVWAFVDGFVEGNGISHNDFFATTIEDKILNTFRLLKLTMGGE